MLNDEVHDEVIKKIKDRLYKISLAGDEIDTPSMQLVAKMLRHKFAMNVGDARIKMN